MKRSCLRSMEIASIGRAGRSTKGSRVPRFPKESVARIAWGEAGCRGLYFVAVIESTLIVLVLASSMPVTLTFCPANFDGVS
jgi:hypothetical protein